MCLRRRMRIKGGSQMKRLLITLLITLLLVFATGCQKQYESKQIKDMKSGGNALQQMAQEEINLDEEQLIEESKETLKEELEEIPELEDIDIDEEESENPDLDNILESLKGFEGLENEGFEGEEEDLIEDDPEELDDGGF